MSESEISQLRSLGATDDYIKDSQDHRKAEAEKSVVEVTLWPDLEDPFRVFRFCKWDMVAGFSGLLATGIPGTEIKAVASMLEVKFSDQLLTDLRVMEAAASPVINAKKSS